VDSVLHRRSVVFPTCASNQEMAQIFGEYFRDKILKLRNGVESISRDNFIFRSILVRYRGTDAEGSS